MLKHSEIIAEFRKMTKQPKHFTRESIEMIREAKRTGDWSAVHATKLYIEYGGEYCKLLQILCGETWADEIPPYVDEEDDVAPKKPAITIELGFIGNKAEKLQSMFDGYTTTPNEYGYFLRFENISMVGNKGVVAYTNCFEDEEHFSEQLQTKLLFEI